MFTYALITAWQLHGFDGEFVTNCTAQLRRYCIDGKRAAYSQLSVFRAGRGSRLLCELQASFVKRRCRHDQERSHEVADHGEQR